MTNPDYRALCAELTKALEYTGYGRRPQAVQELIDNANELLYQTEPPTLMERAMNGDATAAKQFLHEAGFTDKQGQWLPQYQPTPDHQ